RRSSSRSESASTGMATRSSRICSRSYRKGSRRNPSSRSPAFPLCVAFRVRATHLAYRFIRRWRFAWQFITLDRRNVRYAVQNAVKERWIAASRPVFEIFDGEQRGRLLGRGGGDELVD